MAYDNSVTLVGNLTRDPELRYTAGGVAVAEFGLAWNRRDKDSNDVVSFFDVTCWRDLAEHAAESLSKGCRVIVYGHIELDTWETPDGDKRSKVKVVADEVAPSLKWATATVTKVPASGTSTPPYPTGHEPF
jgi:single-strand DNA-binding protein